MPKFDVAVKVTKKTAPALVTEVQIALRTFGVENEQIREFVKEALSEGTFDHALKVSKEWVNLAH